MCYSVAKSETKKQNWLYIYISIFICVIRSTEKVHILRNLAAGYPKKISDFRFFFFYIRLYACLCANDIPKSCKFRFKIGQNSKCKLRFELVTYYLSRGTASSRALTRERQSISQTQLFFPSSLGWPAQKE